MLVSNGYPRIAKHKANINALFCSSDLALHCRLLMASRNMAGPAIYSNRGRFAAQCRDQGNVSVGVFDSGADRCRLAQCSFF